jgi:hypothetical protein
VTGVQKKRATLIIKGEDPRPVIITIYPAPAEVRDREKEPA